MILVDELDEKNRWYDLIRKRIDHTGNLNGTQQIDDLSNDENPIEFTVRIIN